MVDEQLGSSFEEISKRSGSRSGFEGVLLVEPNPREDLAASGELVTSTREFLFCSEEVQPGGKPLLRCAYVWDVHVVSLSSLMLIVGPAAIQEPGPGPQTLRLPYVEY